ncbi:ATP-binding protein [Paenibacillus thermotolerans]|uniref:ATP-binding protein n=1 Tax=Paenibacillus thermotolerans TaxID=3027807 RepID=UPI003CC5E550
MKRMLIIHKPTRRTPILSKVVLFLPETTNEWKLHITCGSFEKQLERFYRCTSLFVASDGTILKVQPELAASLGYEAAELEGSSISVLFRSAAALEKLIVGNAPEKVGITDIYGVEHYWDYSLIRVFEADREFGILLTIDDLDGGGRVNLLQRFAGSFIQDINLGVILIDADFKLVDISDMACRVLGVERERVLNQPMDKVFAGVPYEHRLVQRSLLDGAVVKNYAVSWTNNRERFELLLDSSLLKDRLGRTVGAYVMFKDVTNLRSLEQQVQRSDRLAMIGQIAAGTAHEIRNPLTSIKGFLQVLKNTLRDNGMEKEHGYSEIMLGEIDRINELVNEFLLLSKPRNVSLTKVNVASVIREILPIINNEAILHNVMVQYASSLDMPYIVADSELLKQVFINICKNGIEAMTDGGTLTITEKLDEEDQRVNILIQDTGPGIPAFLIDKIFDPFFTTKEEGTGLGLSVCQRIIHDIGGTIRVSSKGYGTAFIVSVPYTR